jgi:PAS domain S-box-containing protein
MHILARTEGTIDDQREHPPRTGSDASEQSEGRTMSGYLGRRALDILRGAVGGRAHGQVSSTRRASADVLDQAVQQQAANGTPTPAAEAGAASQAARRELEAALARIFTSAADAIVTVDAQQRVIMFNHAAEQLFGCPAGEALGADASRFIVESLLTPDEDHERRLAETGVAGWRLGEVTPLTAIRADGEQLPIDATITPVIVRGEEVFTAAIRDASARVRMEEQLRQVNQRLEQALTDVQHTQEIMLRQERLRALGQLASGIAHDFNNALSMIIGFTELLLSDVDAADDAAKRRAHLQLIHSAAQDAADVVGRLREFSRPSRSSEELPPVQINDLVAQAISLSQPRWRDQAQAAGKTIRVTAELGQVPKIGGRAGELREALTNLIINAVDAMPEGGTLTLRTRLDTTTVVVEVMDTGTGMPPEIRDRIFDPFYTTKGDRGTGLGLAMVLGIVEHHQGEIAVASEAGRGTTFTMRFPALPDTSDTPGEAHKPVAQRARGLRVLLAEDEAGLRQILSSYLRVDGHTIETSGNGFEALEKFQPGSYDLIITDRAMPEMGGDQLAAELKRRGSTTPVIMLTGLGDLMNEVGERPEGVDLVVAKPVTLAELRAAVTMVATDAAARA